MNINEIRLTGKLTLEGTLKDIDKSRATVALVLNDTITHGNTCDGDPNNRYARQYFVPLATIRLPPEKGLDYVRQYFDQHREYPLRMTLSPGSEPIIEFLEPEPEEPLDELLKVLPKHPIEDIFD